MSDFDTLRTGELATAEDVTAMPELAAPRTDSDVVIPSSPQVGLDKKEKTPEVSWVGKFGIFICLTVSLLTLMSCVVYIGFWVHFKSAEQLGIVIISGNDTKSTAGKVTVRALTEESSHCAEFPAYPSKVVGAVGTVFNKRVQICGGRDASGRVTGDCHTLDAEWSEFTQFRSRRAFAAAVSVPEQGWWITGGEGFDLGAGGRLGSQPTFLDTTELLEIKSSPTFELTDILLPLGLAEHCAFNHNDSKVMIIGGRSSRSNFSALTWIIDWKDKKPRFTQEAPLNHGRRAHACFWDRHRAYVAGGVTEMGETASVEVWAPDSRLSRWEELDELPFRFHGGSAVMWSDRLPALLVEGRVFKLQNGNFEEVELEPPLKTINRHAVAIVTKLAWICA